MLLEIKQRFDIIKFYVLELYILVITMTVYVVCDDLGPKSVLAYLVFTGCSTYEWSERYTFSTTRSSTKGNLIFTSMNFKRGVVYRSIPTNPSFLDHNLDIL